MDVALASRLAALPLDEFKALNPSQNKPVILAAGTPQVLLPYDNAHLFVHNLSKHKGALATWTAWLVPKTMRPADAARQLGMPESTLREVNRIPPKMLVKAGSTLLVHRSEQRGRDVSESLADNAMMALAPDVPPLRRMALKAGKRDTVRSVAKRYGISVEQVAAWNKVSKTARFKRGERIVVYVPSKSKAQSSRSVASAKKGRIVREAKVGSKPRLRGNKRVMTAEVKRSSKLRTGAKARNARVRVASAR
jgi:membrane-bound lytic murein transglycosylase D